MALEKLDIHLQKNESECLSYTIYKNQFYEQQAQGHSTEVAGGIQGQIQHTSRPGFLWGWQLPPRRRHIPPCQ